MRTDWTLIGMIRNVMGTFAKPFVAAISGFWSLLGYFYSSSEEEEDSDEDDSFVNRKKK